MWKQCWNYFIPKCLACTRKTSSKGSYRSRRYQSLDMILLIFFNLCHHLWKFLCNCMSLQAIKYLSSALEPQLHPVTVDCIGLLRLIMFHCVAFKLWLLLLLFFFSPNLSLQSGFSIFALMCCCLGAHHFIHLNMGMVFDWKGLFFMTTIFTTHYYAVNGNWPSSPFARRRWSGL